jgi:DNA-binding NarL/FixJ family response regulator
MSKYINIGIADDHLLLRQGLVSLLKEYSDLKVIVDVNNGRELMEALKSNKPDIILLDIEMPVMNGREALEKITLKYPHIKVIIMSMHFNDAYIIEFIKNGACAFLPKNCDVDKILDAILSVYELGYYYDHRVSLAMANLLKNSPFDIADLTIDTEFTKRELDILKLICQKKTNTQIATALNLSTRTVEGHRYRISKKTNTNSTLELIEYALEHNFINK